MHRVKLQRRGDLNLVQCPCNTLGKWPKLQRWKQVVAAVESSGCAPVGGAVPVDQLLI
jgi:hypothetical protein